MPPRKRIVYVIDNLQVGGTQKFLSQLVQGLRIRGYNQRVVCLNRADQCVLNRFGAQRIAVERWGAWQYPTLLALYRLVRLLRQEGADIVQTMLPYADALGRWAGRLAETPAVVSAIRGHKTPLELKLGRLTAPLADALTINTEALRNYTIKNEDARTDRIVTIHNGIDPRPFDLINRQRIRNQLGVSEDQLVIGCVGRLSPAKGQTDLLSAFESLSTTNPQLVLLIAGEGPSRPFLAQQIRAMQGQRRTRLLGHRSDGPQLIKGLDIFVLPSLHEGAPNVLLEAMAAQLPVVATRVGGVPEMVKDGITGLLVPPRAPVRLANAVQMLIDQPSLRKTMGAAGRSWVEERFSLDTMIDAYDQLYRGLLAEQQCVVFAAS